MNRSSAALKALSAAAFLSALLSVSGGVSAQGRFDLVNKELERMSREMEDMTVEITPLIEGLEKLRPQYEDDDALLKIAEDRERLAGRIKEKMEALKLENYRFIELRDKANVEKVQVGIMQGVINGKMPDDYQRQFQGVMGHVAVSSRIQEFMTGVDKRLANDDKLFKKAELRAKDRKNRYWLLFGIGIGVLVLGLIFALFYQTRRIQTTQIAQLVTDTGTPVVPGKKPISARSAPNAVAALEGPSGSKAPVPGSLLENNYRIDRELGRGGMGVVYEATDVTLHRKVAIKRMLGEIAQHVDELELFLAEARTVASLKHPNLVEIYAILRNAGELYLIFEHVAGNPLSRYLEGRRRLSLRSSKQTIRQVAAALDYAHSKKVIHRDLKPANIMVASDGVVKVMDFGIAYQAKMTVAKVTKANPWGTPAYMAPEQELGKISRESDLFALGVLFYEILTGCIPYTGPNFLAQKQQGLFTPITQVIPALPKAADLIVTRALSPDPRNRYHSAGEFAAAVDRLPDETQKG